MLVQGYAALVSFSSRDLGGESLDSAKPARIKEKAQIHFKCTNKLEILIEAETNRRKLNRSTHVFIQDSENIVLQKIYMRLLTDSPPSESAQKMFFERVVAAALAGIASKPASRPKLPLTHTRVRDKASHKLQSGAAKRSCSSCFIRRLDA